MSKFVDLTGQKFGKLLVINRAESTNSSAYWNAMCDCGKECKRQSGSFLRKIKNPQLRSCGCARKSKLHNYNLGNYRTEKGRVGFNKLLRNYKYSAKRRNLLFNLTEEEFRKLTKMNCFYCGIEPFGISVERRNTPHSEEWVAHNGYVYSGIDRIDNDLGYISENCISCCEICNFAKRELTESEWQAWITRFVEFQNSKKING